ncbi:hypothetical protein [Novosphingobium sp.]|uniref:calcium-binding protein n=1 Tax=Novosphingobium sp. TaxID=1874826 RepID=UPI0026072AA1|nr:hypothetical protein [Novosphingobium sp.]
MGYQVATNSSGPGKRYTLVEDHDVLLVPPSVTVVSTDLSDAVRASGIHQSIKVYGFVSAIFAGIRMDSGAAGTINQYRLFVGPTGTVEGYDFGVVLTGRSNVLENHGLIQADNLAGVQMDSSGSGSGGIVRNFGTISGLKYGVNTNGASITISNFGLIASEGTAIYTSTASDTVINRGQVQGNVNLSQGDDRLINRGLITGDVLLNVGADLLDNRGGTIEGKILLGTGADIFMPGAGDEVADGGGNGDTLDFSKSSGVQLALDRSIAATGWAKDDVYTGFANLVGSSLGADILIGDSSANSLSGGGGNDILMGGAGVDTINGGLGDDTITGGAGVDVLAGDAGADRFVFASFDLAVSGLGEYEIIKDFNRIDKDRIDLAAIDANRSLAGDQAFAFIADQPFHKVAGELRVQLGLGFVILEGDTNGDGTPDFKLGLSGLTVIFASDFVL